MLEITVEDYIVNGETFEVSSDMLEQFKKDFPLARSVSEIAKLNEAKAFVADSKFIGDPKLTQPPSFEDEFDKRRFIEITRSGENTVNKNRVVIKGEPQTYRYYEDEWEAEGNDTELGMGFEEYAEKMKKYLPKGIQTEADVFEDFDSDAEAAVINVKQTETGKNKAAYKKELGEMMSFINNDNYKDETLGYIFNGFINNTYEKNQGEFEVDFKINEGENVFDEVGKTISFGNTGERMLNDKTARTDDEINKFKAMLQEDMPSELYNILEQADFKVENIDYNEIKALAETNSDVAVLMKNFVRKKQKNEQLNLNDKYSSVLSQEQMKLLPNNPNPEWNYRQERIVDINKNIRNQYRSTLVSSGVNPYDANQMSRNMEFGKDYYIPQTFTDAQGQKTEYKNASLFRDKVFKLTDPADAISDKEKKEYFDALRTEENEIKVDLADRIKEFSEKNTGKVKEIADLRSQIEAIDVDSIDDQESADWYTGLLLQYRKMIDDYETGSLRAEGIVLRDEVNYVQDIGKNIMNQAEMLENVELAAWASQFNYNNLDKFLATVETELVAPAMVLGAKVINTVASGASTIPGGLYYSGEALSKGQIPGMLTLGGDVTGLEGRAVNYFSDVTEDYQEEFAPPSEISDVFDDRSALTFGNWMTGALAENGLTIAQVFGPSMVARASTALVKQSLKQKIKQSAKGQASAGKGYYPNLPLLANSYSCFSLKFCLALNSKYLSLVSGLILLNLANLSALSNLTSLSNLSFSDSNSFLLTGVIFKSFNCSCILARLVAYSTLIL